MIARACALWLAILTALPFTAPFATFHLSDFFGSGHTQAIVDTVAAPTAPGSHEDDADDIAASGACFQRMHFVGAGGRALVESPTAAATYVGTASWFVSPGRSVSPVTNVLALSASLRL